MQYSTKGFKKQVLVIALSGVSLGLTACGGNNDYQAHSCLGQASGADDCRHFNQAATSGSNTGGTTNGNAGTTTGGNTGGTTNGNAGTTTGGNTDGTTSETTVWQNFIYDASQLTPLTANASSSFEKHHEDESFDNLAIVGKDAVVASHYHNRLRRFILTDGVATLQQAIDYATAPGGRDEVDSVSGATEQLLSDVDLQASAKGLVVTGEVNSYNGSTDKGVGIYVNKADSAGNFTPIRFASSDSTQYYPLSNITAQSLSDDGQHIIASDKSGKLVLLDSNTLTQQKMAQLDFAVHGLTFSSDGKWIYASGKKKIGLFGGEGVIAVLDAQTLAEKGRMNSADEVDFVGVWALDNQQLIAQVSASKYALMLQWQADGSKVVQKRQISMPSSIKNASVMQAKDGHYLALSDSQNNINVIQLSTGKRAGLTYKTPITDLAFDNQNFVWILSGNSLASVPYAFN